MTDTTDVRLAVAAQPTVAQGIVALLRSIVAHVHRALVMDEPGPLKELVASIDADAKAWTDAVLANTSSAPLTASLIEPIPVQPHVAPMFAAPPQEAQPTDEERAAVPMEPNRQPADVKSDPAKAEQPDAPKAA